LHPTLGLAEEEMKTEQEGVEDMDISTGFKDPDSADRTAQKRKFPHPIKKKKKPGLLSNSKEQVRHGPFYCMKQPLTTDPVDVIPQNGQIDFYCWVCHWEGQVLCCELCPWVYHAKCLRLTLEPEGDWFCPECEVSSQRMNTLPALFPLSSLPLTYKLSNNPDKGKKRYFLPPTLSVLATPLLVQHLSLAVVLQLLEK
ncbi:ZMYND8-like, partial [Ictidomys tridecemlineatus]|uniref:PHD-type domain-containing protein n=1 Tax=Ictidomys tridecemlineatus TaxID=43179 RepID=A0A287D143_ICTTR